MKVWKIRAEQLDAFQQESLSRFVESQVAAHGSPTEPSHETRDRIKRLIHRAAGHEIVSEDDVAIFIWIAMALGDDFDSRDDTRWAAKILRDSLLRPGERVRLIQSKL